MGARYTIAGIVALGATLLAGAGCAPEDAVAPTVSLIASDSLALSDDSITSVDGTYTNCVARTGSWSARVSGSATMSYPALSVVRGDSSCQLAVTRVATIQTLSVPSPVALGTSYWASPSAFAPVGGGPTALYANVKLDAGGFGADFGLSVLQTSVPPLLDIGTASALYATVTGFTTAALLPASNYTLSLTSNATPFTAQLDAAKTVTAVSGLVALKDGTITGLGYAVDAGTLGATADFGQLVTAYNGAAARIAITGANPTIPASAFGLVGVSLATPVVRTVILIQLLSGVTGVQAITVTFKAS